MNHLDLEDPVVASTLAPELDFLLVTDVTENTVEVLHIFKLVY